MAIMTECAPSAKKFKQSTLGGYFCQPQTQGTQNRTESDQSGTDDEQNSEPDTDTDAGDRSHVQPSKLSVACTCTVYSSFHNR